MINNYEIKKINNEEVLYLFLDYSVEFAKINSKSQKQTLNKEIDDYIKKNKIKFKGRKIIIMASGLILGACLLKAPLPKENPTPNYMYSTNMLTLNEDFTPNTSPEEIIKNLKPQEETAEKKEQQTPSSSNKTPASSNKVTTAAPKKPSQNKTSNPKKIEPSKQPVVVTPPKVPDNQPSPPKESAPVINQNTSQMVTIKRSNGSTITLELEEYLIGVVAAEMPASFNIEALKAQAIAARTYALKAIENKIQLTDTVSTQVYKDNTELQKIWGNGYNTYYNKVKKAVLDTKNLVMYYNNSLINAYYHSTSNGYTEDATAVFGSYPYLKSVESPLDKNVSSYAKTLTLTYEEISNKLGIPFTSLSQINIEKNSSNRVKTITIDNNSYDGVKFRTILGLRSTDFEITLNENNVTITTRGYGHGVGMSQYGANEYAKKGWSYTQILKHYYTGINIAKY